MHPKPRFLLLFCAILLVPTLARAHQSGKSEWRVGIDPGTQRVNAQLTLPGKDLARGLGLPATTDPLTPPHRAKALGYLNDRLGAYNGTEHCVSEALELGPAEDPTVSHTHVTFRASYHCKRSLSRVRLHNSVLTNDRGGYQHLALIHVPRRPPTTTVFDASHANFFLQVGHNHLDEMRSPQAGFHWIVMMFGAVGLGVLVWTVRVWRRGQRARKRERTDP